VVNYHYGKLVFILSHFIPIHIFTTVSLGSVEILNFQDAYISKVVFQTFYEHLLFILRLLNYNSSTA